MDDDDQDWLLIPAGVAGLLATYWWPFVALTIGFMAIYLRGPQSRCDD